VESLHQNQKDALLYGERIPVEQLHPESIVKMHFPRNTQPFWRGGNCYDSVFCHALNDPVSNVSILALSFPCLVSENGSGS